ncbi:MAG: hypothetical protein PHG00_15550 [Methylococcales bacterium]|nr:hypothetical protein [Methylococcales bacterium]
MIVNGKAGKDMKKITFLILNLFLLSACSPKSELDEANKKIAELQSQLEIEKAKNKAASSPVEQASETKSTATSEPETESKIGTQWIYSQAEDKMSGGTTYHAYVLSTNTVEFSFPYNGIQNATLHLRTDPKYGKDVIFRIEKGQILCNSYEDCTVLVRFDDEKPANYSAVGAADNSNETVFFRNYSKFVGKLLKAKQIRISTNIYQQGSPVFEFDVSGFNQEKYKPKR